MKTPSVVPAIAERKHLRADQIAHRNSAVIAALTTLLVEPKKRGGSSKVQDRKERRGIPYVGTGGIDTRRDPLLEVLEREAQATKDARIRSKRKTAAA